MTFDPKYFYRQLDELLQEIDTGSGSGEWFEWLLKEMLRRFGAQLSLASGRLYSQERDGFRLECQFQSPDAQIVGMLLPSDYPPLRHVMKHGVCVLDSIGSGQDATLESRLGGAESVGLVVNCEPRRILAFGLTAGWNPEQLNLALHTIRNAINNRLTIVDLHLSLTQLAELQKGLVPEFVPTLPGFSIAAKCLPYAPIGGDFYDFQVANEDCVNLAIGDACGHGLPAALVARDVVTGLRMAAKSDLKIAATIRRLNEVVAQSTLSTRFVSLLYGELESNGNFFYVNAGHLPGMLFAPRRTTQLKIGGCVLGPLEDATFKRGFSHIDRGSTLVLVTDGVTERKSPKGKLFGFAGVENVVKKLQGGPAGEILDALLAAVEKHADGEPVNDDTSLIIITRDKDYRRPLTRRVGPTSGDGPQLSS